MAKKEARNAHARQIAKQAGEAARQIAKQAEEAVASAIADLEGSAFVPAVLM